MAKRLTNDSRLLLFKGLIEDGQSEFSSKPHSIQSSTMQRIDILSDNNNNAGSL